MNDRPLILYHGNCTDGFGAAWAAWKKFGDNADYQPVSHGGPAPVAKAKGRDVYLLDFCYDAHESQKLKDLINSAAKVVLIDHHKTTFATLADSAFQVDSVEFVVDLAKSGAVLAWEHFHPGTAVPKLLLYVQAGDLWDWDNTDDLDNRRQMHAYLASFPTTFDWWDVLGQFETFETSENVRQGAAIIRESTRTVYQLCKNKRLVRLGGHEVWAVNAPHNQSYVCEAMIEEDRPFGAAWFVNASGLTIWSLRSRSDFDVSEVASAYGGGGHAQAAGFQLPIDLAREVLWPTNSRTETSGSPTS